jgi:hemerythrin-like domain-containing protein
MRRDSALIPLSHQHHNGLALCVLTRRSLATDSSAANVGTLAQRIVDRFEIELTNHFAIEEEVLFPACGASPLVDRLVSEHRAIEGLVGQIRNAPTAELLEQFCELLNGHIRLEENEFFQQVQESLPRDVLDRVGGEIDQRAVRVCL